MKNSSILNDKKSFVLIFLIILIAGILRFLGIWHGYPFSYYPDEAHFVKRALSFGSGNLNPLWFHKPAFFMYILFFEYGLYFVFGKITGMFNSVADFAVSFVKNPGPFYLIGRLTTTIFSLGSIWVVYLTGERHFKKGAGIIAALLLTLSYGHIVASQYVKADIPAMFFVILSIFFLLNYSKDQRFGSLIWASVFAGMGTATKAYPIVMLVPIVAGVIMVNFHKGEGLLSVSLKKAVLYIGATLVVFTLAYFICAPYNFIDPLGREATFSAFFLVKRELTAILGGEHVILHSDFLGDRTGLFQGLIDYLHVLVKTTGMGVIIAGIGMMGIIYLVSQLNRDIFLFLLYPVLFAGISVLVNPGYAESRHQLPVYPFLAVTGGALIAAVAKKSSRSIIVYVLTILLLCYPFYKIVNRAVFISKEDTRNIAKTWIEENIPAKAKILIDEDGPELQMSETRLKKLLEKAEQADKKGQFTAHYDAYLSYQLVAAKDSIAYDIYEIRFPWWRETEMQEGIHELISEYDVDYGNPLKEVGVESYEYYVKNGFEYVIVNSDKYNRFLTDHPDSRRFPSFIRFYKELFNKAIPVKVFSPHTDTDNRPGPEIKIFKL